MLVWFICDTVLYNNIACMRLLCSIVYICMYCGIICLLCARLRLWVNSATMRFYGIFAPGYSIIGNKTGYTWQYLRVNYTQKSLYHFKRYKAHFNGFIILAYQIHPKAFYKPKKAQYKTHSII